MIELGTRPRRVISELKLISRSARRWDGGSANLVAVIACWRTKYDIPRWRPETAIQLADTDGNDATVADVAWVPLVATPPYPEYPSGHACVTGAMSGTLAHLFGADAQTEMDEDLMRLKAYFETGKPAHDAARAPA